MFEQMELELHESGMYYLTLGERLVFNFMAPSSAAVRGMSYSRRDKLILQDKVGRRSNLCKLLWVIFWFFGVLKEIQLVDPGWWSLIARHPYEFDKLGVCCWQLSGYDRFGSWVGWFNPPFATVWTSCPKRLNGSVLKITCHLYFHGYFFLSQIHLFSGS